MGNPTGHTPARQCPTDSNAEHQTAWELPPVQRGRGALLATLLGLLAATPLALSANANQTLLKLLAEDPPQLADAARGVERLCSRATNRSNMTELEERPERQCCRSFVAGAQVDGPAPSPRQSYRLGAICAEDRESLVDDFIAVDG